MCIPKKTIKYERTIVLQEYGWRGTKWGRRFDEFEDLEILKEWEDKGMEASSSKPYFQEALNKKKWENGF